MLIVADALSGGPPSDRSVLRADRDSPPQFGRRLGLRARYCSYRLVRLCQFGVSVAVKRAFAGLLVDGREFRRDEFKRTLQASQGLPLKRNYF